jgi:S1 RNA binding domain protein
MTETENKDHEEENSQATEENTPKVEADSKDAPAEDAKEENTDIVSGEVTNVTNFGAFVKVEAGEEGLVHISEIANEFVKDINEFVKVGDIIKVKVLGRNNKNKLELSIKKATEGEAPEPLFIKKKSSDNTFEDKLSQFLKRSEEKQIDIRRNLKQKQGISKKKR